VPLHRLPANLRSHCDSGGSRDGGIVMRPE
jgi:hypothetical protein